MADDVIAIIRRCCLCGGTYKGCNFLQTADFLSSDYSVGSLISVKMYYNDSVSADNKLSKYDYSIALQLTC